MKEEIKVHVVRGARRAPPVFTPRHESGLGDDANGVTEWTEFNDRLADAPNGRTVWTERNVRPFTRIKHPKTGKIRPVELGRLWLSDSKYQKKI